MNRKAIEANLQDAIDKGAIDTYELVHDLRYALWATAMFEGGGHPVVMLDKRSWSWWFHDQGNTLMRSGVINVEVSMQTNRDGTFFVEGLRTFVDVLLAIDASESIKAVARKSKQEHDAS